MILALKTDSFDTELHLCSSDNEIVDNIAWYAGRELSVELLSKIQLLLKKHELQLEAIEGIIVYEGPGSFTGLRIGVAVANALGYGLDVPVVATTGSDWVQLGIDKISKMTLFTPVQPKYGSDPHITQPKK